LLIVKRISEGSAASVNINSAPVVIGNLPAYGRQRNDSSTKANVGSPRRHARSSALSCIRIASVVVRQRRVNSKGSVVICTCSIGALTDRTTLNAIGLISNVNVISITIENLNGRTSAPTA